MSNFYMYAGLSTTTTTKFSHLKMTVGLCILGVQKAILATLRVFSLKKSTVGTFAVTFYDIKLKK